MLEDLPPKDRELVEKVGLQIGRAIDERKGNFGRGDFLIRNILSLDRRQGHLTIGDMVHENQTVQFQVQDSHSADEDLRLLLQGELLLANAPAGVLMFTCNGRGTHLFGSPHHDIGTVRSVLGSVPIAGFFCAGELGPVGGRNFIHGQTVSLALFR
jgi:small ligand-binding sensory domain FIST